jgi:hypothetical protein
LQILKDKIKAYESIDVDSLRRQLEEKTSILEQMMQERATQWGQAKKSRAGSPIKRAGSPMKMKGVTKGMDEYLEMLDNIKNHDLNRATSYEEEELAKPISKSRRGSATLSPNSSNLNKPFIRIVTGSKILTPTKLSSSSLTTGLMVSEGERVVSPQKISNSAKSPIKKSFKPVSRSPLAIGISAKNTDGNIPSITVDSSSRVT